MQAIETKFLCVTATKGDRIKATCPGGSKTISYPYELNTEEAHKRAAMALIEKMGWKINNPKNWVGGSTKAGYVFIYCPPKEKFK